MDVTVRLFFGIPTSILLNKHPELINAAKEGFSRQAWQGWGCHLKQSYTHRSHTQTKDNGKVHFILKTPSPELSFFCVKSCKTQNTLLVTNESPFCHYNSVVNFWNLFQRTKITI
jgi:hypothetical protein